METENYIIQKNLEKLISFNNPSQTGMIIPSFPNKKFDVYEVPLEWLKFNPYNDRIASYIRSYEFKNKNKDINYWFSDEGQKLIANFLWESDVNSNDKTKEDLLRNKQHTFAIIDKNGLIIDGNRRVCILKKICSEINYKNFNVNFFNKLKTIIIWEPLNKNQVMELETEIQMGQDGKIDYQPIEKYLKVNKLLNEGFPEEKIASLIKKEVKDIREYKQVYNLMNSYLDYINAPNQFEFIKRMEDHFINLNKTLNYMRNENYSADWKYDDTDIFDFQIIAFCFVRSGYEGKKFRKLLGSATQRNGPFANKKMWDKFKEEILEENNKAEKRMMHRIDLMKKEDQEAVYKNDSNKIYLKDKYNEVLRDISRILEIKNDGFKGQKLMKSCLQSINEINNIFEEIYITSELKKDFKKIKEIILNIDKKLIEKGKKDD
ncbi:hypothetical protein [Spiroplasma platyhelix]|uniref:ParB/Sulfiredoxin domain-containing protein n=1 Tax=Spiroplasma platyhelix PALS-1 TaxID=1276218 RepID=A0A846TX34_9MOLU|nr:hypothetical protein [Spiroplasma platyhelix]MBE4704248.1 hypothetical protein [Spiroplasma platyhelix PALS-1]NKE38621.1 hypothetical protein [Spiroplasma platyhelix PALS-1]UJB28832.1 hypothetical protein SPLAT_v1c00650 [Spiroplasma platyhelix PALS-1]